MPSLTLRSGLLLALAALLPTAHAENPAVTASWKAELERIMANPDWIGPPVEAPFWALDGKHIHYSLKRDGSSLRDLWSANPEDASQQRVADDALAALDAAAPVWDATATRAAFVRAGDVFVRHRADGRLQQLTRTPEVEAAPVFAVDGHSLVWRVEQRWYRHDFATGLSAPLAELKAEKAPDRTEADALRDMQLRLIATLAREKADRDGVRERERELRAIDASRAAAAIYLGDEISIADSVASPDARWMLVVTELKAAEAGRAGKLPKYVTESGYEEFEDARTRVGRNPPGGQGLLLIDLVDGSQHPLSFDALPGLQDDPLAELRRAADKPALEGNRPLRVDAIDWNPVGDRAALTLRSVDNKDRWIATVDPAAKRVQPRHRLHDDAWINWNFNEAGWLPDGRTLWFLSEETGYSQLYLREDRDGGKPTALTRGEWEASAVVWTRDGSRALFLCNRAWPGDYEVCEVERSSGKLREVTRFDSVASFVLSPDETRLALTVSAPYTPPQLAVVDLASRQSRQLTDTRSEAYRARSNLQPQFVQVPSKHGAPPIWGKLYRPATLQAGKRYPIALFVHGAGYLQNVTAGWPNYFREQMFNQLLVEHGYLVLDLDYRASEGYGRAWRTAIYRQMGHPELEDYLDGIDWLVDNHQGERGKVGIYGGSYGGFMAFMALMRAPEAFHAGAALRPVSDWTSYNHEYTSNILNTPELDPEAYRKSSPIEYAENLHGQLLIAHGMIDDNVFYQDSVRLAQRLIELRKDGWELASYPLERHGYVHPEAWYDQYRRIFELFERTLK